MKKLILGIAIAGALSPLAFAQSPQNCGEVRVTPLSGDEVTVECQPFVPPNQPPVAVSDSASGGILTAITGNVLSNDTDPENDTLSVVQPNADIAADGSFTFNFATSGDRVFNYLVTDGELESAGQLTVTVTNDAPVGIADAFSGLSQTAIAGNVLTNDTDPNSNPLTVVQPNADFDANGAFSKTFTTPGVRTFSYTATDGDKNSASTTVTITVDNRPPVVNNDNITGNIPFNATGNVLSNDSDPDGGTLSIQQPNPHINADGSFNLPQGAAGGFDYPYTVIDGQGGSTSGVLHVQANTPPTGQLLAFPGAEGYGRFTSGGRGGAVIQVTNLNDSGPGSLRACVAASGARTCVFRVAGTISVDTPLQVNSGNLTIAGETAPGQGIAIKNGNILQKTFWFSSPNIIVRHIRVRPGPTIQNVDTVNCFGVETERVMLDHVTCSWATDQLMYTGPANKVTIQDSLFYEGLERSTHTSAVHSKGVMLIAGGVSAIRNLLSSNSEIRCPNLEGSNTIYGAEAQTYEIRNNVVFNCRKGFIDLYNRSDSTTSTSDDTKVDAVGNVVIKGPETFASEGQSGSPQFRYIYPMDAFDRQNFYGLSRGSQICLQDNLAIGTFRSDRLEQLLNPNDSHLLVSTNCYTNPVGQGMTAAALPVGQVEAYVYANAGAFPNNRDASDARIVSQTAARQGAIIDHPSEVGGWPTLAAGSNYPDADADGMDDTWETSNLGGTSATANGDADGDGYTNLEEFLHFMAATR